MTLPVVLVEIWRLVIATSYALHALRLWSSPRFLSAPAEGKICFSASKSNR
jgi:hypothetical protein